MSRKIADAAYTGSVFLNCPFDVEYKPIFFAIIFTIIRCGYTARCALEAEGAGATRIDRIYRLIEECGFGIHDISRIEHDQSHNLPRFNMPFELGVFLGAMRFGPKLQRSKHCLILDTERYRYQKFLSDIAGQDIRQHANDPTEAVGAVRDWLATSRPKSAPRLLGAAAIMQHYREFEENLPTMLLAAQIAPHELGFFDRANLMAEFLMQQATRAA